MRSKRKRQRTDKSRSRRARQPAVDPRRQGVRPWILPGLAGIAVIAIVLIGVSAFAFDNGDDANGIDTARVPSPAIGEPTAQVVIHEYGDYQCAFCGVFARSIKPELQARFIDTGIARLVWHDFAWYGDESHHAANAARCAGDQGQFWEYHDLLFDNQQGTNAGAFSRDNLKRFGEALGLEAEAFGRCVDGNTHAGAIEADLRQVRRLGLNGTPSFTIGAQHIIGAQPIEAFEQAITTEIRQHG